MVPGPLMLDIKGLELDESEAEILRHPMVGGVIFFARNFSNRQQIGELSAAIRQIRPDILLAVDQEGGRVQRFKTGYTLIPPMAVLGRYYQHKPEEGAQLLIDTGWLLASEIIASGVDFSFAPVLDVDDHHCKVIANRSFAADAHLTTKAARYFIEGMHEAGMAATGKHFPGHGGVGADSHLETPTDTRSLSELQSHDLLPFSALVKDLEAVMPAHIVFPEVDEHCVGFSPYWLQKILRQDIGFEGVIFSDDLSMKGADVAGGYADKAKAALEAGCDMILVCNNPQGALVVIDYLVAAGHEVSSRLSAMAAKKPVDWSSLEQMPRYKKTINALTQLRGE